MRHSVLSLVVVGLLATACKPQATASDAQVDAGAAAPVAAAPAPEPEAKPAIEAGFREGMSFADLRKQLIDAGWLPLRDPMCRENVGGTAEVCFELPEVESCSGDGYCKMHYANAAENRRISVTTYGPYDKWNVAGEESALAVRSWKASALHAGEVAAPACPSSDFDTFLKAFASDEKIERAFTAPLVKVADLGAGVDGTDSVLRYDAGTDYAGFNVAWRDGAYHFAGPDGSVDKAPLELQVEPQGDAARIVRYGYGMSEGNSYRFEQRNGCWALTEDPEPPSP
ncbi:MAG: hypothetical protein JNM58_13355 [Xanthomonadaceae bacterium]|nr:hypothetical protein [Xanthomonadaceae bacterium]